MKLLLLSGSIVHGSGFLEWCASDIKAFLSRSNVSKIVFVPYAQRKWEEYTSKVRDALHPIGIEVEGINETKNPVEAINKSQAIFIGGGNTFLLLKTLYEKEVIKSIQDVVLNKGIPYIGSSAGSNVATCSIHTTNDMPICYPPSFNALCLVPFNINPHYIATDPNSTHMGETRDKRIEEYMENPLSEYVLGLPEGTYLLVEDGKAVFKGKSPAKVFFKDETTFYKPDSDLSFLMKSKCKEFL